MLIALGVVTALAAYAFSCGAVYRILTDRRYELFRYVEELVAAVWPMIPLVLLINQLWHAGEYLLTGVIRAGGRATELPGRLIAWRRSRRRPRLHDDCVLHAAWLSAGGDEAVIPHGPCVDCERELARYSAAELPRAVASRRSA